MTDIYIFISDFFSFKQIYMSDNYLKLYQKLLELGLSASLLEIILSHLGQRYFKTSRGDFERISSRSLSIVQSPYKALQDLIEMTDVLLTLVSININLYVFRKILLNSTSIASKASDINHQKYKIFTQSGHKYCCKECFYCR